MDILSNRELSILIWIAISVALLTLLNNKHNVSKNLLAVIKCLFAAKLRALFFLIALYELLVIIALSNIGVWELSQIKTSIIWYAASGIALTFRLIENSNDEEFFKKLLKDNFKILILLEYLSGFHSFSLIWELLFTPAIFIVSGMYFLAEKEQKYKLAENMLLAILTIYGLALIVNSAIYIYSNFERYSDSTPLLDIFTPLALTVAFIPFLYFMRGYVAYELAYNTATIKIKNKKLRRITMCKLFFRFNIKLDRVELWKKAIFKLPDSNMNSKEGIEKAFEEVSRIKKSESLKAVPTGLHGWVPSEARMFLRDINLVTRTYHPVLVEDDEWWAGSDMLELDEELHPNNIAYYLTGTEDVVREIKIKVNINNLKHEESTLSSYVTTCEYLCSKTLYRELPEDIKQAILNKKCGEARIGNYSLTNKFEKFTVLKDDYDQMFSISVLDD